MGCLIGWLINIIKIKGVVMGILIFGIAVMLMGVGGFIFLLTYDLIRG